MLDSQQVRLTRNGALVGIESPAPTVRRTLDASLFYYCVASQQAKWHDGRRIQALGYKYAPIACYNYVHDKDKLLPPRLTFAAGFINRVAKALKEQGYKVLLRRVSKHPHPEVFEPRWDLLKGVKWRWGQKPAIERLIVNEFGQLQFPTGYGKSWVIRAICRLLPKARIAITTPSDLPCVGLRTSKSHRSGSRITCYSMKSLQLCEEPGLLAFASRKHRRTAELDPIVLRLRGDLAKVEDTRDEWVFDARTKTIVERETQRSFYGSLSGGTATNNNNGDNNLNRRNGGPIHSQRRAADQRIIREQSMVHP